MVFHRNVAIVDLSRYFSKQVKMAFLKTLFCLYYENSKKAQRFCQEYLKRYSQLSRLRKGLKEVKLKSSHWTGQSTFSVLQCVRFSLTNFGMYML